MIWSHITFPARTYNPSLPIKTSTSPHDRCTLSKTECLEKCGPDDDSYQYELYHDPIDKVYEYQFEVDITWCDADFIAKNYQHTDESDDEMYVGFDDEDSDEDYNEDGDNGD